jgi:hypothetical protein
MKRYGILLVSAAALALFAGCSSYNNPYYYRTTYASPVATPGPYVATDGYTQAWLDSCSRRYRSFNPVSGTYLGYDGIQHYCVL